MRSENSKPSSSGKIIGAFIVGAAVGAALGILFAPDKGSVTRRKLFNSAEDLSDEMNENVKEVADKQSEKSSKGERYAENKFEEIKKNGREKIDSYKNS